MLKRKGLSLGLAAMAVAAALMLSACGAKTDSENEYISHGENISNGDVSLIVDSTEGEKAPLTRPPEAARVKLTVGVVKNDPAALTLAYLANQNEEDEAFEKYELVYADNYTALANMLKDGSLGAAVMSPSKGLDLYAADKSVKAVACLTGQSYRLVGENISSLSDLSGKTVYMSEDDKASVCIMTRLVSYAGVKDCSFEFVPDNSALYSKLLNKEISCALLTEPYVSMLKQEGVAIGQYDFSGDWVAASEGYSYCSGSIIVTNEFLAKNKAVIDYMLDDVKRSVEAVKSDSDSCAQMAEKQGLADNAKAAAAAYTSLDCGFYKNKEMRFLLNFMFTAFENADSEVFGTDVPDEEFYLVKE